MQHLAEDSDKKKKEEYARSKRGSEVCFCINFSFRQLGLYFTSSRSNYASLAIIRDERNSVMYSSPKLH